MKNRCPFAEWEPLGSGREPAMDAFDIVCEHTAVSPSLGSLTNYFDDEGYYGVESHFGVGLDGRLFQFQSLDLVADANLDGNWHVWSIENADGFGDTWHDGDEVPGFTEAQIETNIRLLAWLCDNGDIPARIIPNSRRGNRGIGWHRMGVPGYMVSGGEQWSSSRGKVCPGDRKIHQIETEVIPRIQGDDVSAREVWNEDLYQWDPGDPEHGGTMPAGQQLHQARGYAELAYQASRGTWDRPIPEGPDFGEEWQAGTHLRYQSAMLRRIERVVAGLDPDVDEDKLAAALAPKLKVHKDTVAAALREVLTEGVGDQ